MRQSKFRDKVIVEAQLSVVSCNVCEKQVYPEKDIEAMQDMHRIVLGGGYGTTYPGDMQTVSLDICGSCFLNWTKTFKIPVTEEGGFGEVLEPEFIEATHSETGEAWIVDRPWAYPKGTEFEKPSDEEMSGYSDATDLPEQGVYEHFKGQRYEVLRSVLSFVKGSLSVMVVYRALYGESQIFVQPLVMWNESIVREGYSGPRFRFIG